MQRFGGRLGRVMGLAAVLGVGMAGCSDDGGGGGEAEQMLDSVPDADIHQNFVIEDWAMSARHVYMLSLALATFPLVGDELNESTCPVVTTSGTTTTVRGGCTDEQGQSYEGSMTIRGAESQTSSSMIVSWNDFTISGMDEDCGGHVRTTFSGSFEQQGETFTTDLALSGEGPVAELNCAQQAGQTLISYAGSFTEGPRETWNGSGELALAGEGKVALSTQDAVVDDQVCTDEFLSGTTEVRSGGSVAVIRYDGATACDDVAAASWTLDGVDQGFVDGLGSACSVDPQAGWAGALWLLMPLLWRRRRPRAG